MLLEEYLILFRFVLLSESQHHVRRTTFYVRVLCDKVLVSY